MEFTSYVGFAIDLCQMHNVDAVFSYSLHVFFENLTLITVCSGIVWNFST